MAVVVALIVLAALAVAAVAAHRATGRRAWSPEATARRAEVRRLRVEEASRLAESKEAERLRRESDLAEKWYQVMRLVRTRPGAQLISVERNYQTARRGTKSWVRWCTTDRRQDTWFWGRGWPEGTFLVVVPSIGWGPHNQNPSVLYLEESRIVQWVDLRWYDAAMSVERRRAADAG